MKHLIVLTLVVTAQSSTAFAFQKGTVACVEKLDRFSGLPREIVVQELMKPMEFWVVGTDGKEAIRQPLILNEDRAAFEQAGTAFVRMKFLNAVCDLSRGIPQGDSPWCCIVK
jgi:hypothetical protein